ncbi:MAG: hypothetical protein QHC40_12645 [Sphingobium sp.]|nr:hypothetical protein [Sphingobium sp.]
MAIITIDFEASCLPRHGRSYPIEVGIACPGMARNWLIRPHQDWRGWDWTDEAQALHGLTPADLERGGVPVSRVFDELAAAVAGHRIVADSLIDQYWLDTLCTAAGTVRPFAIDHVSLVIDELGAGEQRIAGAVARADGAVGGRHRAAQDAAWLAAVLSDLGAEMARLPTEAAKPLMAWDASASSNLLLQSAHVADRIAR